MVYHGTETSVNLISIVIKTAGYPIPQVQVNKEAVLQLPGTWGVGTVPWSCQWTMSTLNPSRWVTLRRERVSTQKSNGKKQAWRMHVHYDQYNRDALYFPLQTNATIHSSFFATLLPDGLGRIWLITTTRRWSSLWYTQDWRCGCLLWGTLFLLPLSPFNRIYKVME